MSDITLTIDGSIATIQLNRADKGNALSQAMLEKLTAIAQQLQQREELRAVFIQSSGKHFCTGADLEWMKAQFYADEAQQRQQSQKLLDMLTAINNLPMIVVGFAHGAVYGGGLGLLAVCDRVLAEDNLNLCFSESKLGLIPATISPFVYAKAGEPIRAYFMSAQVFDAQRAQQLGLVSAVIKSGELSAAIDEERHAIERCDVKAIHASKALLKKIAQGQPVDVVTELAQCWQQTETRQRIQRFFDR